ncbi:MAG: electron transport complex subunit RsxC [Treponema sp.]|nr:electron transport complex subunit RsxC [Treponema sp.]
MAVSTFKRGLKLDLRKNATEGKATEIFNNLKQAVIPVNQHFGAPNKPIVSEGDHVKQGQKIADSLAPGPMTVPVHASISGTVKKIEPRLLQNNIEGLCIIIENSGTGETGGNDETDFLPPLDPFSCTKEESLSRIREAGIIGMGGAGFPAHVKFNPPANKKIDIIIANGAECEPFLTTDETIMAEKPEDLVRGLSIVMNITGVKKAMIGLEDNKEKLIPVLQKEIGKVSGQIEISIGLCKSAYPQGGEKMLIKALTGREVPSGGLPMDAGCIVSNVRTLAAVAQAFAGRPVIERDLTVAGGACGKPKNIRVPIGTVLTDLPQEFLDIKYSEIRKIIFGGPMMGFALPAVSVPIQKNTSGILLLTNREIFSYEEGPCIRCARCIRNCPCSLSPVVMNNALDSGEFDEAVTAGLLDCIECGTCSYVCPARIKLTQRFRTGKQRFKLKQQNTASASAEANSEAARADAQQNKRISEFFKDKQDAAPEK